MTYKIYIASSGVPVEDLHLTWLTLTDLEGISKKTTPDLENPPGLFLVEPPLVEIGGGWYKFEVVHGTPPFDVPELVGVIDAGNTLSDSERYIPVVITLRDLALPKLVNKATYDLVRGVETIRNDEDTADELTITLSQAGNVETRILS